MSPPHDRARSLRASRLSVISVERARSSLMNGGMLDQHCGEEKQNRIGAEAPRMGGGFFIDPARLYSDGA